MSTSREGDIPTPLVLPFGLFPNTKDRSSGVLIPTYGESQIAGFFLKDGGYYLLGMKKFTPAVFQEINWSTATVLKETLHILKNKKVALLTQKNDIDTIDDIKNIEVFQQYINS